MKIDRLLGIVMVLLQREKVDEIRTIIIIDKSVEYLLVEAYGPSCYVETEDGELKFIEYFTNEEHIIRRILSFGDKAVVIEPVSIKEKIQEISKNMLFNYNKSIAATIPH